MIDDIIDTLDSFEVRQLIPESIQSPNVEQNMQNLDLVLKLLSQTSFFQSLRNNYQYFKEFTHNELKKLVRTAQMFRVKSSPKNMVLNFNQATICTIIFGQVITQGKTFAKGDYFIMLEGRVELFFKHKSTLVMLHKEQIEHRLYILQNYYFKKKQIQSIFPVEQLQVNKEQMNQIVIKAQSLQGNTKGKNINRDTSLEQGLFILFQGNFQLKMISGICLTEIGYDYYGQQILWSDSYAYGLQALTVPYRFIFLSKKVLLSILSNKNIEVLKQLYKRKTQLRCKMAESIQNNIAMTKKFIKKIEVANKLQMMKYRQIHGQITRKPITKQLVLKQKNHEKDKNQSINITEVQERTEENRPTSASYKPYCNFKTTLYKDQKAQSQRIFRRKIYTQPGLKRSISLSVSERAHQKPKRIRTEHNQVDNLPKTISVLVKHYESKVPNSNKIRQQELNNDSRLFLSSSKDRRILTNMKLHKQIFFRQYFDLKKHQDTAFKTWR